MSEKKKRILVIGYFGYVTNQLDGQTVKTRAVYDLLKQNKNFDVKYADTQELRHSLKKIYKFLRDIILSRTIVILPCLNNLRYIFPLIYIISTILRQDIIHVGIGGWHSVYLKQWPLVRRFLRNIKINLLENTITCEELSRQFNITNVEVFPNFREDNSVEPSVRTNLNLRLVFMARMNIKKGLDTISEVANEIQESDLVNDVELDFYGPFDSDKDRNFYESNLDTYSWIHYKGILQPEEINHTLNKYDVMLFPTHYYTEGFPGTILDALRAGVPVVCTEWKHSHQFIQSQYNGIIVNFNNPVEEMVFAIRDLLLNKSKLREMQANAFNESKKYLASNAEDILFKYIRQ